MPDSISKAHAWAQRRGGLRNFTVICRQLLALGLLQPGKIKILEVPFSQASPDSPGGFGQITAVLPLLVPPLATSRQS